MVKKVYKNFISHGQRMLNNAKITDNFQKCKYPDGITEYVEEVKLVDGIKEITVSTKTTKFKDMNKGLRWYDFSIDSLEVSGAIANLVPSKVGVNNLALADNMIAQADKIEKNISE